MTNSRNKGASFEREIANELTTKLELKHQLKRILEQTREKHLPDLILGRWYLECKRYGSGNEPMDSWWEQVVSASGRDKIPALIYKFDRRPIKVRVPLSILNENFSFNENIEISIEVNPKDINLENIPKKISLLRLDTDWYSSTKKELEILFPLLEKNGILIIDDYGYWQGARKAVDEFFKDKNVTMFKIDFTGRMIINSK